MKYRITFYSAEEIVLPVQYNHILQAALLQWLGDTKYAAFLHDQGYAEGKRNIKLYTFSNLYGNYQYRKDTREIVFKGEVYFWCSFYERESDELIRRNVERKKPFRLGERHLAFIKCESVQEVYEDCVVNAVSPITVHSTAELQNGKKRTYYYEPYEKEFSEMIRQNLIRKYKAYYGIEPESSEFQILCLPDEKYKQVSIYYRKFVIKGWRGRFCIARFKRTDQTGINDWSWCKKWNWMWMCSADIKYAKEIEK